MRPTRLELEGFTTFRERVTIEFDETDLFAFTGATGAGKSSLIDAMVFALYGSIPRYGNEGLVRPVISQGLVEARVRFDFSAGGRDYSAVRVVRRTKTGATTKEARLESGDGPVLAGSARELTQRIERDVLGLSFAQFTTCVVLPQGDFAHFLNDEPSKRQDLLVRLLGLGLYEQMASLTRAREAEARGRSQLYGEQLGDLQFASTEARDRAKQRVDALTDLHAEVDAARPELERLRTDGQVKASEAQRLGAEIESLESLRVPAGIAALSKKLEAGRAELRSATKQARTATDSVDKLERSRRGLGDVDVLRAARRDRAEQLEQRQRREKELALLVAANERATKAAAELERADAAVAAARTEIDATRRAHAAHDLRGQLADGEPCPVCLQIVAKQPRSGRTPAVVSKSERALTTAETKRQRAEAARREHDRKLAEAKQSVALREQALAELERRLEKAPSSEEIEARLESIRLADEKLDKARETVRERRAAELGARDALDAMESRSHAASGELDSARDRVASLSPPAVDRDDLAGSWAALVAWAQAKAPELRTAVTALLAATEAAARAHDERRQRLLGLCAEHAVVVDDGEPWTALVDALGGARAELARLEDALTKAQELRTRSDEALRVARVSAALAKHLRADGFERWLLESAFERLVTGASVVLRDLSVGQYSLACDDRLSFEVVDHRNADERRSTRTLSGGETFLASLALALTLAEQIQELAAEGSAPLESIFLDEGFGTLDAQTLDTVATAIEELSARGRMVGIVTHVADLADRIPVQYRVEKGPTTSTVSRVEI